MKHFDSSSWQIRESRSPIVLARRQDPLVHLPAQFGTLDALLQRMTIVQPDGTKGLLGLGQFGDAIHHELKEDHNVQRAIDSGDQRLISALFRDYCFAASAYLLEDVHLSFLATGNYIAGKEVLPRQIAVPLKLLADSLLQTPFMEYASSYALQNYRHKQGPSYDMDNLSLIRAFADAEGSEAGFILIHISMVAHSGAAISGIEDVMTAARFKDRLGFNASMSNLLDTYRKINIAMENMWSWSRPVDYLKFRSFIFGTAGGKANKMFPKGVIYEGVSDEPMSFRGESGSNDGLVPILDNLLEITAQLPENELTEMLRDFRTYRPSHQRSYIDSSAQLTATI